MTKVPGCCDACGKEADRLTKIHLSRFGKILKFDFCDDCMRELSELSGDIDGKINELLNRHER